jgi:hypothetical protein
MFRIVFHLWLESLGYAQTIKDCNSTSLIHVSHVSHVSLDFPPCLRSTMMFLVLSTHPQSSIVPHCPESVTDPP